VRHFLIALAAVFALPATALADGPVAYQSDPQHTGVAQGTTFSAPLGKRWVRRDLPEASFPVLAEGKVFLTSGKSVYALDRATGATVWSRALAANGVAYDDGKVFAVGGGGILQALDPATGKLVWTSELPGTSSSYSPPSAYDGMVYVSDSSTVYGARQDNGLTIFSTSTATGERSIPAVDSSKVYDSNDCGEASAIDRSVGLETWRTGSSCGGRGGSSTPVVRDDRVYVPGGAKITVRDTLLGMTQDTFAATQPPVVAPDASYVVNAKELYARTPAGTVAWTYKDESSFAAPPVAAGGYVYAITEDGRVVALAKSSGQKVWESELGTSSYSDGGRWPGLGAAGDTLVVSYGDRVSAYGTGPDTPGVDDPDKTPQAEAKLEFKVTPRQIFFGRSTVLTGRLTLPYTEENRAIHVEEDAWPYDGYQRLPDVKLGDGGTFSVKVRPDRNTRYRVVYDGTAPVTVSKEIEVFSDYALKWRIIGRGRRLVLIRASVAGPLDMNLRGDRFYVYWYRARGRVATRIGSIKLRGKSTHVRGSSQMRTPAVIKPSDYFYICRPEKKDDGFGKPDTRLKACGRKRVR
jgi:outer membrane protein assembly factor BamB